MLPLYGWSHPVNSLEFWRIGSRIAAKLMPWGRGTTVCSHFEENVEKSHKSAARSVGWIDQVTPCGVLAHLIVTNKHGIQRFGGVDDFFAPPTDYIGELHSIIT